MNSNGAEPRWSRLALFHGDQDDALSYNDTSEFGQAMIAIDSHGTWAQVNAGPNPGAALGSVTCIRTGFCVAVGGYLTAAIHQMAMQVTEVKGHWSRAIQVRSSSNAGSGVNQGSYLGWVTCIAGHSCVAVGYYVTNVADREAMAATLP